MHTQGIKQMESISPKGTAYKIKREMLSSSISITTQKVHAKDKRRSVARRCMPTSMYVFVVFETSMRSF